jgi:uncharacterized protein (DUF58 family)
MNAKPRHLSDVIEPAAAAHLRQLVLFARQRVEGRHAGENRSVLKGFSTDFLQHRPYYPGDNLKYLDWRVYARTNRYVVREYEETTNLDLYLVLDVSASMGFAGDGPSKHACAVRAAAVFFYLMLIQRDTFGLALFADQRTACVEPAGGRRHLLELYGRLLAARPAGTADWRGALQQVQSRIRRRGLAIVLSDFMADPAEIGRGLSGFRSRGCDTIAVHIIHPRERALGQTGMTRYVDLEDGSTETVDPLLIRDAYARQFHEHATAVRDECTRRGAAYCDLVAGDDEHKVIGAYLRRRMALGR